MVHLHRHDSDSVLDGVGTPLQAAKRAAELNQYAIAQTNHGNLNGSLKHIKACDEVGIHPICGIESYWRPNRLVREKEWRFKRWHILFLAKNLNGWHNLIKLSSEAFSSGMYQNPCVDFELMERYKDGIICSSSCVLGPLSFLVQNGSDSEIKQWIRTALDIYGYDLYFSIMPHDFDLQRKVNLEIISYANQFGIPIVYEGDSHYPFEGWDETQKISILIGINKTVQEAEEVNQKRIEKGEEIYELWHSGLHITDETEVRDAFISNHPDIPLHVVDQAIKNTDEIASRIEPFLVDRSVKMPVVKVDAESEVKKWCREGMERIEKVGDPVYEKQLNYELEVIKKRENYNYFYITIDWIRWCKSDAPLPPIPDDPNPARKRPMRVGSGRGSAAGSLVSYLCQITTLDPIAHKLKFERFLNPERKGLPDVDIDFPTSRRPEAKEYVIRKHGREKVADIMSQQHFTPIAALKKVTKALYGFKSDAYDEITIICHKDSGLIDTVHDSDLEEMKLRIPQLEEWSIKYPTAWLHASRLENGGEPCVMTLSKHAAGMIVAPTTITDLMPTIRAGENEEGFRTAWSETPKLSIVEDFGFVKWDALGLTGMDQQQMIIDSISDRNNEIIDLDQLPILKDPYASDSKVMEAFQNGLTLGVNQFSGQGITNFIKRAKPDNVVHLAALNALFRPGPMGAKGHFHFADRKNGKEEYEIPEILENVLGDTFGVLSFQEQVMDLFEVLVGYTPGQADGIRKIIAKLYRERGGQAKAELEKHKANFIDKASVLVGKEVSDALFKEVEPYCDYSFNRGHASGYSVQSYQDQWLKVYYPMDTYAVIMTLEPDESLRAIREAREFDIDILPPDINISKTEFTPDFNNKAIRYGLEGIKGIKEACAKYIMELRPFTSYEDFEKRTNVKYSKCNKGHREKLLKVGALDSLGGRAGWSNKEKAEAEMELLGMALSPGGTLGDHEQLVVEKTHSEAEYDALDVGDDAVIGGQIAEVKKIRTKKGRNPGQEMAFVKVSLGFDNFNLTLFPNTYSQYQELLFSGNAVMVRGHKDARGMIVDGMMTVEDFALEMAAVV